MSTESCAFGGMRGQPIIHEQARHPAGGRPIWPPNGVLGPVGLAFGQLAGQSVTRAQARYETTGVGISMLNGCMERPAMSRAMNAWGRNP